MKTAKIVKLVSDENWEVLKTVSLCDDACRMHLFDKKKFDSIVTKMEEIHSKWGDKTTGKISKIVDGKHVMRLTGMKPGPKVGELISKVTDWAMENGVRSQDEMDKMILRLFQSI
jgi:hypothetical protein